MKCELGHLFQADGSASFGQGKTVVWVSVFGAGDLKASRQKAQRAVVEINLKPKVTSVYFVSFTLEPTDMALLNRWGCSKIVSNLQCKVICHLCTSEK